MCVCVNRFVICLCCELHYTEKVCGGNLLNELDVVILLHFYTNRVCMYVYPKHVND